MAKLQPDYITWTLSINASQLQSEILKIKNESKKLKETNKDLKESMKELVLQGKYQSKEYKELEDAVKANNRAISENNEKMKQCERQVDTVNKSYAQLSRQAKKLQLDLDNTVKSLNPAEYARLEKEIEKTKKAMERLKPKAEAVKESFTGITKMKAAVIGFFAGIGASVESFFLNSLSNAKEWANEGIRMAASADGVRRAFDKLNQPGLLDKLRTATKGTVNDLELMKKANFAEKFRIPLQDLDKYLKFAQIRAQETGQSIDYMTDSIVTGLGRQSIKILDNLGLSAAEINEEVAKTGDFMQAVANIVDKELAKAGENYVSATDRAAKKTAELQNKQMEIGTILMPIKAKWTTLFHSMKMGFADAVIWVLEHKDGLLTLIQVITGWIVVVKTAVLLQKAWNGAMALGKAISFAYTSVLALQEGNLVRSAKAMRIYNALVSSNNLIVKACTASTYLFAAAKAALTGKIAKARIAMQAFNTVVKITPLGIVATLISLVATALLLYYKHTQNATTATEAFADANKQANASILDQRTKLDLLWKTAENEKLTKEKRLAAIRELNKISPEYLGNIDLETIKTDKARKAKEKYIESILAEALLKAAQDKIVEKQKEQLGLMEKLEKRSKFLVKFGGTLGLALFGQQMQSTSEELKSLESDIENYTNVYMQAKERIGKLDNEEKEEAKDLIQAKKEEIELLESESATTLDALEKKNKKLAELNLELQKLQTLGVKPKRNDKGNYSSEIDKELSALDNKHKNELLKIKEAKEKEQQTEAQYNEAVLAEDERYYAERIVALGRLSNKTAKTKLKTLADIQRKTIESNCKLLEIHEKQDENEIALLQEQRDRELALKNREYDTTLNTYRMMLYHKKITQEQFKIYEETVAMTRSEAILFIEKKYCEQSEKLTIDNGNVKKKAVEDANKRVLNSEKDFYDARLKAEKTYQDNLQAMRNMFQGATDDPGKRLQSEYDANMEFLESAYKTSLDYAKKAGLDETKVEQLYANTKLAIYKKYCKDKIELAEKVEQMEFIEGNQLSEDFSRFVDSIRKAKKDIEEIFKLENLMNPDFWKNYKKDILENMSVLVNSVTSGLRSAFSTFEQIEIDNVEAKYNAEIEAAQGNSEKIEQLEQEKAQKKLDIEKKYADVQFGIKAAEILANTALAIMMAYGQLGPIAGPIAAVFMGAVGAVQLAAANAERQKVKSMTLSGSSSSSSIGSAERVVNNSGFSEGGYTGDGGRYEVAGAVHRGEYVIPAPEMKNARVLDSVRVIEGIRRQRTATNPLPGYSEGGLVTERNKPQATYPDLVKAAKALEKASENLSRPTKNYVLLSEINVAEEIKYQSEKPFTRGDH